MAQEQIAYYFCNLFWKNKHIYTASAGFVDLVEGEEQSTRCSTQK